MNIFRYGALALVALVSCLAFAPSAEARWAPTGSYQSTCRHIQFDGDMLTATCQRRDGSWRNTYMVGADDCDGTIVNRDGQLECSLHGWHDGDHDADRDGPSGPYERSCENVHMDGYTLKATCQRRDGSWRWASLEDAYDCDGRIANFDGHLVCGTRH